MLPRIICAVDARAVATRSDTTTSAMLRIGISLAPTNGKPLPATPLGVGDRHGLLLGTPSLVQMRITPHPRLYPANCGGVVDGPEYTSIPAMSFGGGSRSRLKGVGSGIWSRYTCMG